MATVVTLADQGRTQAMVDAERERALEIKAGDWLTPDVLWNQTTRPLRDQLPNPSLVLWAAKWQSQTGVMVSVRTKTGGNIQIDAGWFVEVQRAGRR